MNRSFLPPCRNGRPAGRTAPAGAQAGVALVITLILLSVITFMAVTFLVVSRSQRHAVSNVTEQTMARNGAESGLRRALAELAADIQSVTNEHNYDLRVSTNYFSPAGFNPNGAAFTSPTNVNYDYLINGGAVSGNNALQNLANLLYNPRAPVYFSNEFRYYLDLNRNGRYDTNGLVAEISPDPANPFYNPNGTTKPLPTPVTVSNYFVGDPEWVGVLARPELRHSASNLFLYRYAYIALPAGKSLDLNYIHNYAKFAAARMRAATGDGFLRNQGVGTFELNLAGLLADLNTNYWTYTSYVTNLVRNEGTAFDDAASLLRYRYGARAPDFLNGLYSIQGLFGVANSAVFTHDGLDSYSAGPVMGAGYLSRVNAGDIDPDLNPSDRTAYPWPGSDNPSHFFTLQGLYDRSTTAIDVGGFDSFTDRLLRAGTNLSSYDRYTFYRLAAQLGTDTAPEVEKLNLNYKNVDEQGHVVPNMATNFIPWEPVTFFTNAANRLLANAGFNFNVHSIQIWPTNCYTPSVHRLLQLAANIYDSTTNRTQVSAYPYFPSVFRPLFYRTSTNTVIINGYEEVVDDQIIRNPPVIHDLSQTNTQTAIDPRDMVYGVPLVIGAKKGFPNFNELSMQTQIRVTRRLEFRRPKGANDLGNPEPVNETNQMYTLSISNVLGVEAWNSYSNAYPRDLELRVAVDTAAIITNEFHECRLSNLVYTFPQAGVITIAANQWRGYNPGKVSAIPYSFQVPILTNFMFLTNATYREKVLPTDRLFADGAIGSAGQRRFVVESSTFERHPAGVDFTVPHWWFQMKSRLRFYLVDQQTRRIVDYVNLEAMEDPVDLTDALMRNNTTDNPLDYCGLPYAPSGQNGSLWCTNRLPNPGDIRCPTYGILNQWHICYGDAAPVDWSSFIKTMPAGLDERGAIDFFRVQFDGGPIYFPTATYTKTNVFYTPFNPSRNLFYFTRWQVNDPLVHYTIGDLVPLARSNRWDFNLQDSTIPNLGSINDRYEPWGGKPDSLAETTTRYDVNVKDPRVFLSENWDFPTNKFPSIGWLGRVHRGTPWQTVYLKSTRTPINDGDPGLQIWKNWTGNGIWVRNIGQLDTNVVQPYWNNNVNSLVYVPDAAFTHPVYDRYILDLFSASVSDNIARGQLSINQTNLAAWSAVLSGVVALTNASSEADLASTSKQLNPRIDPIVIDPAGVYDAFNTNTWSQVVSLVRAINAVRATNNNLGVFTRLGDILAVPELTVASPFLNTNGANIKQFGISEAAYERLPQQLLGLLQCEPTPRFVIYSYGQALKPADRSLVSSGAYFQLCTNYQVTAEVATRTVVRFEGVPYRFPSTWAYVAPGRVVGQDPASGILPQRNDQPAYRYPYPGTSTNTPALNKLRAVIESFNILPPD